MSEDRKKIIAKLIKIKALAERGVGGEQATAQLMYDTLKKRYGITDEEVSRAAGGTVDITEIDLKQCWGLAFALGVIANNLLDEMGYAQFVHILTQRIAQGAARTRT